MPDYEEIDYTKFKGKYTRPESQHGAEYEQMLIEKRIKNNKEDAIKLQQFLTYKANKKHKYSPIRHSLPKKQNKDETANQTT